VNAQAAVDCVLTAHPSHGSLAFEASGGGHQILEASTIQGFDLARNFTWRISAESECYITRTPALAAALRRVLSRVASGNPSR
jgi:hypothetical protein